MTSTFPKKTEVFKTKYTAKPALRILHKTQPFPQKSRIKLFRYFSYY